MLHIPLGLPKDLNSRFQSFEIPPHLFEWVFNRELLAAHADRIKHICKPLPHGAVITLLRTWSNGWFTTHRIGGRADRRPCIFGCEGCYDELKHYITCEPLWTLLHTCVGSSTMDLTRDVGCRLCLVSSASPWDAARLMTAFQAYHAVRNIHDLKINTQNSSSLSSILLMRIR